MISMPFAHVGGIPIEETLWPFAPALLVVLGVAWTKLRVRLRRVRSRASAHAQPGEKGRAVGRAGLNRNQ
jgi:uncharacterized membrane protein